MGARAAACVKRAIGRGIPLYAPLGAVDTGGRARQRFLTVLIKPGSKLMKAVMLALSLALLTGPVSAQKAPPADLKAQVTAGNAAWIAAFAKGDAAGVAALYTETATMLPPGAGMQKGRAAIEGFVKAAMGSGLANIALTTTDLTRTGPVSAREIGILMFDAPNAQKQLTRAEGKYVVNWRLVKGKWMLDTDIWNTNK